jgi:ferritin-like metal-binding protein YciE
METTSNIRLTSAEMGCLWETYMNDSMATCVLTYFLEKVEDSEIKSLVEFALSLSKEHIRQLAALFKSEAFPIPKGFTEEDVNLDTPRIFADTFMAYYIRGMGKFGLAAYGIALSNTARKDIIDFISACLDDSKNLVNHSTELQKNKGIFIRPPYITVPEKVDFIKKQNFLNGWFGEVRPLLGQEIAHIYMNHQNIVLGKALTMGFSQVARSEELRKFFWRGVEIGKKQIEVLQSILLTDNITAPVTWDGDVLDSTVPPFSDKLMMFHIIQIGASAIGNYGGSIALTMRRDVAANYTRLLAESAAFVQDGMKMMIENEWMEQPPQSDNRKELARI